MAVPHPRAQSLILTSASLVRTCEATDKIDEKLRVGAHHCVFWSFKLDNWLIDLTLSLQIEVFLPPNQRVSGTLVAYNSCYNLAVVRPECLRVVCPEDILLVDTPDQIRDRQFRRMSREELELKKKVVAVGREPEEGLLCASFGVVTKELITSGCKELRMSTCKIKKVHRSFLLPFFIHDMNYK